MFLTKNPVSLQELKTVPVPEETATYVPVGHGEVAEIVKRIGSAYLGEHLSSGYGLSKDGQQMFGVHRFKSPLPNELTTTIGFRNSLNKTLSWGVVGGTGILVCDNQCFFGEFVATRKHTRNVMRDAIANTEHVAKSMYQGSEGVTPLFDEFVKTKAILQETTIDDDIAWAFLGVALGRKVIRHQHHKRAMKEWKVPRYPEWNDRTAWALYNACTEAMKGQTQREVAHRFIALHALFVWWFCEGREAPAAAGPSPIIRAAQGEVSNRFRTLEM